MAGSKKKRGTTLIILLIAMIVLIGACFWVTKYKEKQAKTDITENTSESTTIVTLDTKKIKSIYLKNEDGELTLTKNDKGVWKNPEDEQLPVNQTYAGNMINALGAVTSSKTITGSQDDLTSFGLSNPKIQITATSEDGKETKIAIGDMTPVSGSYYAAVNGDNKVYVVSVDFYNNFTHKISDMVSVETIPNINADNITYLRVENKDKSNFEISYDENKPADYGGFTQWTMHQPYPTDIPADADAVKTLLGNYTGITFTSCVEYNAKDLSKYGLDNPASTISLKYFEQSQTETDTKDTADSSEDKTQSTDKASKVYKDLEILIGTTDADGNYYVKLKDSNAVNVMSAETVKKLIEIDAYSNAFHNIGLINIKDVDSLEATVNGETYTIRIEQSADTAKSTETAETADSKEKDTAKYYFNDKLVDTDAFKDLYQIIISSTTERDIPEGYANKNTDEVPHLTLVFHLTSGKTINIKYLPYDESYYAVNMDGTEYFLTDLRGINKIADSIQNFQK